MRKFRFRPLLVVLAAALLLTGCGSDKIVFVYPDEALDSRYQILGTPALFLGAVTDLRPPSQRQGEGKFFKIRYPKDEAWEVPPTQIYAEALIQDVEQTHLFELRRVLCENRSTVNSIIAVNMNITKLCK